MTIKAQRKISVPTTWTALAHQALHADSHDDREEARKLLAQLVLERKTWKEPDAT